jgi:hypothetical protein
VAVPTIIGALASNVASFTWPTTQAGDLMLIALSAHWSSTATVDVGPSAGFVEIGSVVTSGDATENCRQWLYGKIADGTEGGTTETMGTTATQECGAGIVLRGTPSVVTIHASASAVGGDLTDPYPTAPSVTSTVQDCIAVLFHSHSDDAPGTTDAWTGGSGTDYTHRARQGSSTGDDRQIRVATADMPTAATISGKRPATVTPWSNGWVVRVLVIRSPVVGLPPDSVAASTNLTGAVTDIDDTVDTPDGNWMAATTVTAATDLRVTFGTPAGNPTTGAGIQKFRMLVRKTAGAPSPTVDVELWENGSFVATLLNDVEITSTTGQIVEATWDASLLSGANGANVECRIVSTPGN